jgi:hypothetical protein
MAEHESATEAFAKNRERLKAQRLAREAGATTPPPPKKKKEGPKAKRRIYRPCQLAHLLDANRVSSINRAFRKRNLSSGLGKTLRFYRVCSRPQHCFSAVS